MTLYLVQHGDALGKAQDPERPLSDKGLRDVRTMASFLAESGVRPRRIIHSGKTRAMETAMLLYEGIGDGVVEEIDIGLSPNDPTGPLKDLAESWDADIMVVGHLPFMGRMVAHLLGAESGPAPVAFEPGSVACLQMVEDGNWRLQWMIRPSLLQTLRNGT